MRLSRLILFVFLIQSCVTNDYNTTVKQDTQLLPTEGLLVVSIKHQYPSKIFPNFLVAKAEACVGFDVWTESPLKVANEQERTYVNVKKMPAGRYRNAAWSLFYNGPPSYGSYSYPAPSYNLEFDVVAGEVTYIGEIITTEEGITIVDELARDISYVNDFYPSAKSMNVVTQIPTVGEFFKLSHCQ